MGVKPSIRLALTSCPHLLFPHHLSQQHEEDSTLDVHICNSFLCTACRSKSCIKFIKITDQTPPKKHEKHAQTPSSAPAKTTKLPHKLIIENISSVGAIRAYSTNNQEQGQHDNELFNRTESLSDDESVLHFIESIENGTT